MNEEAQRSQPAGEASPAFGCSASFGWIACSSRMPDLGDVVWLWQPDLGPYIGSREDTDGDGWLWGKAYDNAWWNGTQWKAEVYQEDDYQPTHWMPLPRPPFHSPNRKLNGGGPAKKGSHE